MLEPETSQRASPGALPRSPRTFRLLIRSRLDHHHPEDKEELRMTRQSPPAVFWAGAVAHLTRHARTGSSPRLPELSLERLEHPRLHSGEPGSSNVAGKKQIRVQAHPDPRRRLRQLFERSNASCCRVHFSDWVTKLPARRGRVGGVVRRLVRSSGCMQALTRSRHAAQLNRPISRLPARL